MIIGRELRIGVQQLAVAPVDSWLGIDWVRKNTFRKYVDGTTEARTPFGKFQYGARDKDAVVEALRQLAEEIASEG